MSDRFNVSTIGRLTRDPELRFLSNGSPVASFGVCTNQDYKDKNGEWVKKPLWSDWEVFGERAKFVSDRLKKGVEVYLEGEYSQQAWEDKTSGEKRTSHRFRLTHFRPLTKAVESDQVKAGDNPTPEEDDSEVIPF